MREPCDAEYACLLLNRPLGGRQSESTAVWNSASLRVAVDGGANVLRELIASAGPTTVRRPDLITGDLDSISDETRKFFAECEVVETPDQDATDFTKALRVVSTRCGAAQPRWVTAIVDTSGRVDQILANVNTLLRAPRLLAAPVFQLAHDSLSWVLAAGEHSIWTPAALRRAWCALAPVGERAERVTTTGLRWNLSGDGMQFGALVSTSNELVADVVTVQTSHPLLFSMDIP